MAEATNIRKQMVRVAEHWAEQRGVNIKELLFRLRTAPLVGSDPDWDPTSEPRSIEHTRSDDAQR